MSEAHKPPAFQHRARKRFGQNFLQDPTIIRRIVQSISLAPGQRLIEIGPGKGAITAPLMARFGALDVIELDRDLASYLRISFATQPGFRLFNQDVMSVDFAELAQAQPHERPLVVIGNLPYNISTPLIFHLLSFHELIDDMRFMLQLEVVQRLCAKPGTEHYGRLSVMVQYYCAVEQLFLVPPGAFHPAPKVTSAVVRLQPHRRLPYPAQDPALLSRVVREAFNQRRKTIRNALKQLMQPAQWAQLDLDPGQRPETLSLQDYVRISDLLTAAG